MSTTRRRLRITFSGICTHFAGIVPGVPHRAVLPDASAMRFGLVTSPFGPSAYYLLPHFALLTAGCDPELLTIPGLMEYGLIYSGVRIQLLNAAVTTEGVGYADTYNTIPHMRHYVPRYEFSQEVVYGGRAACYFDLYGGTLGGSLSEGGASQVIAEVEVDGPPQLMITPFTTDGVPSTSTVLTLDVDSLVLGNVDADPKMEDKEYDFLLHYLTAQRGIPEILAVPTPGMTPLPGAPPGVVEAALHRLAPLVAAGRPSREEILAMWHFVLNPSCSDSRYP